MKNLALLLLISTLLAGCGPAVLPPPPTITLVPSRTPPPTRTATPTTTPSPPLQTDGPYLLFTYDNKNFTIMDADGSGRQQFQLPNDGYIFGARQKSFQNAISPDGKWLAYFTGSSHKEPYDLALHLFNLTDQTTIFIANVISPGFPENLAPVRVANSEELENCTDDLCRGSISYLNFLGGIESIDWSPDSQSLAFPAQIDGPSSDVYIFNIEDKSIRRLVDDLENVWFIDWSPNGKKILFQNSLATLDYSPIYIYVADPNIKSVQSPNAIYGGSFWQGKGWINDNSYLIWHGGEGAPPHDLRYINVESQQIKKIWPYIAESLVIDFQSEALFVSTIPGGYINNEPEEGTYFIATDGSYTKITDDIFTLYEGFKESQVFGRRDDQIYSVLTDGAAILLGSSEWTDRRNPVVSTDQNWILILETQSRIALYSTNSYAQVNVWDIGEYITQISWRPDSLGVFLLTEEYIYYLPIPNGRPIRLQDCSPNDGCMNRDLIWLP
jgi:hypothetical protein